MFFKFLLFLVCLEQTCCLSGAPVVVNNTRGTVLGYHVDYGNDTTKTWYGQADVFLGIPFALPPVGNLRYKVRLAQDGTYLTDKLGPESNLPYPRPLVQYPGPSPYNATFYRLECVQPTVNFSTTVSEDCLFVNIYTPKATSTTRLPVMIWIHGGGLIWGNSHLGIEGIVRNFVSKGIVVASLDYRMSWLGFFTTFTDDFPPNIGMLDQVLALKFLKEEIAYFGGDPNRITIFGESAGGHSVSSHTYSPLSQNLFQQVITESGNMLTCYEDSVGPTDVQFCLARHACNYTREMWDSRNFTALKDCLMNISIEDGTNAKTNGGCGGANGVCWDMVQDNYFFPGNPQTLYKSRPNIPAIIGICKDEYGAFEMGRVNSDTNLTDYTRQQVEARLTQQYSSWFNGSQTLAQEVIQIWENNYLPNGTADDDHMLWLQFAVDVGTAAFFAHGALRDIEYYLMNNNPNVYTYEWAWSSPINNGGNPLPNWHPAIHGCEVSYVLGYGNWDATDQALANLAQSVWANFAIYGKPTLDNTFTQTKSSDYTALEYFQFSNASMMKTGFRSKDQIAWNQLIPPIMGDYPPNLRDNNPVCSRGYTSAIKSTTCYEAFGSPLSWNDSQTNCVQNSYGALVSVSSAFENSDLLAYAKQAYPSCTGFYIGLFESTFVSNWTWVNYEPSAYRNWKDGYPKQTGACTVLNANDGSWTNQDCNNPQCYVCSY